MSTTILTHSEYECTVCHIALDRIRINYGGLSCLSCRAFFRRMCQKENIAECKERRDCRVSFIDRVSCPPCRFQKCVSAGMKSELIGNEGKNKRKEVKPKLKPKSTSVCEKLQENRKRKISTEQSPSEDSGNNTDNEDPLIRKASKCIDESDSVLTSTNESTLDPETGLIVDSNSLTETSSPRSISSESAHNVFMPESPSPVVTTQEDRNITEMPPNPPPQIRVRQSVIQQSGSPIDHLRAVGDDPCMESDTEETDDFILQYLHKKFDRQGQGNLKRKLFEESGTCSFGIKKVLIFPQKDIKTTYSSQLCLTDKRESVIVPRLEQNKVIQIELKEDPADDLVDTDTEAHEEQEIILSLTVKELENIYTTEETKYVKNMINNFYKNWKSVNLGSKNVSWIMSFLTNPGPLFEGYFLFKSKIFRKRILSCVCDTEELNCLPAITRYNLMKSNIRAADLLIKLFWFNLPSTEFQIMQGEADSAQWKASSPKNVKLLQAKDLMELVPLEPSIKSSLQELLSSVSDPILGDWSVIVHMTMLVILRPGSTMLEDRLDAAVENTSMQLWTMLRRYLTNSAQYSARVEHSMASIQHCLATLPIMLQNNKEVFSKFV